MGSVKSALMEDMDLLYGFYFAATGILMKYPIIEKSAILDSKIKEPRTDERELRKDIITVLIELMISETDPKLKKSLTFSVRDVVDHLVQGPEYGDEPHDPIYW